jgi:hypothetical protein
MSKNPKKIFLVEEEVYPPYREGGEYFTEKGGFKYREEGEGLIRY